jgi:hypothetical protein
VTAELLLTDDHIGNTQRQLDLWVENHRGDASLAETALFIEEVVADWHAGICEGEEGVRRMYGHYLEVENEDQVSDISKTVLVRAPKWFAVEAGLSPETEHEIWKHYLMKEIIYGKDF